MPRAAAYKNIIDVSSQSVAGVTTIVDLVVTVDSPAIGTVTQVRTGATVRGIQLDVIQVSTETPVTTGTDNVDFAVVINRANAINFATTDPANMGSSTSKRFTFHQWQCCSAKLLAGGIPQHHSVFLKMPKGFTTMENSDRLQLIFRGNTGQSFIKIKAIYMWYT